MRFWSARSGLLLALAVGVVSLPGCVSRQWVPLDLGPAPVELFVDGERAEEIPPEIELRADRDHKLFVKRAGFVPELVVLETREIDGREALVPGAVRVRLRPAVGSRDIEIQEAVSPAVD